MLTIHQINLRVSNAFLVVGERPILIDTGTPHDTATIRAALRQRDLDFSDLALIVHTHAHSDHMGSTAEIVAEARCPIAYHADEQAMVDRGDNGRLQGLGLRGNIMSRFFSFAKFQPVMADFFVTDQMRLDDYGVAGSILHTPGHTAGSVSFVADTGEAIIGDLLMGGYVGGKLLRTKPNFHYFADDRHQVLSSVDLVLMRTTGPLYVGHGGPLGRGDTERWRRRQL